MTERPEFRDTRPAVVLPWTSLSTEAKANLLRNRVNWLEERVRRLRGLVILAHVISVGGWLAILVVYGR